MQTERIDAHVISHLHAHLAVDSEAPLALGRMLADVARIARGLHSAGQSRGLHAGAWDQYVAAYQDVVAIDLEAKVGWCNDPVLGQTGDQEISTSKAHLTGGSPVAPSQVAVDLE